MKPSLSAGAFLSAILILILSVVPAGAQISYQGVAERTVLCSALEEAAQPKSRSRAYAFFERARRAFIAKNNKLVLTLTSEAINIDPAFGPAYILRGYANIDLEQPLPGLADFDRGIKLYPSLKTVNLCDIRAKTYIDLARWEPAVADLTRAIVMQPMPWRYKMRGEIYATTGKNELALKDFDSAIKMTPASSGLYRTRADFYTSLKRYKEAIADYGLAIKFAPTDPSLYGCRANAYEKSGRHDLATADRAKSSEQARNSAF